MTAEEWSRQTIIKYRLERAGETLDEATSLKESKHYHGAVNRLYYSCFYAVTALLYP